MGSHLGTGITVFEPEMCAAKVAKAAENYREFQKEFNKLVEARDTFGWGSQECQQAKDALYQWQQERGMVDQLDQNEHLGHPII